jgi:hypothetical protein
LIRLGGCERAADRIRMITDFFGPFFRSASVVGIGNPRGPHLSIVDLLVAGASTSGAIRSLILMFTEFDPIDIRTIGKFIGRRSHRSIERVPPRRRNTLRQTRGENHSLRNATSPVLFSHRARHCPQEISLAPSVVVFLGTGISPMLAHLEGSLFASCRLLGFTTGGCFRLRP